MEVSKSRKGNRAVGELQASSAMQLLFSGAIRSRVRPGKESDGNACEEAATWVCRVCGKKNPTDNDADESEVKGCKCCGRERDPAWLFLELHDMQLQIGDHVQLPDDPAFGTRVGVVVGIDFFKKRIQLLDLSSRATSHTAAAPGQREVKSASGRRSKLRFDTIEYDASQLQQLSPVSTESLDPVHELITALEQHGLCGECRRVFRIAGGDVDLTKVNEEATRTVQDNIRRCNDQKRQNIKLRYYDRVLENTRILKALERQLSEQKRTLEFLEVVRCPHCGWSAGLDKRVAT